MWACIVPSMDHNTWVREHKRLSDRLGDIRARRDELVRHSEYIPGPVLQKRDRVLERLQNDVLDQLAGLWELDRLGAVK